MRAESYGLPASYLVKAAKGRPYRPSHVAAVLERLIDEDGLTIDEYLPAMAAGPFFLVAATGLGKTVAVPPHVWLRQCQHLRSSQPGVLPRVWVVEPRVMIADEQAPYMHETFRRLHRACKLGGQPDDVFGSISSSGPRRADAPILFVTTGVFTMRARNDEFHAGIDRVIIDEAHETLAQNPDVELAIAICRQAGVVVDYMSATVDTGSIPDLLGIDRRNVIVADKKRHPIYVSNVGRTMEDSIVDIVRELLIDQRRDSPLLPPRGYPEREQILSDLFDGAPRAHGLLIAINTITGARSDTARVRKKLAAADLRAGGRPLDVLELSGEVNKTPSRKAQFERQRDEIEAAHRPYVVIATSVIEMGVTIGTLDYVVTMDSGFANVVVGDRSLPEVVPLPFNSLKQRLGRVGRRRAGVGLITSEVGAPYTALSADQLNGGQLEYDPVKTPLGTASLLQLAFYTYEQGWRSPVDVARGLTEMRLPSRRELLTPTRLAELVDQRRLLQSLGVVGQSGELTEVGQAVRGWLGDGYLPYAVRLQQALMAPTPARVEVLFWTVALAASDRTLSRLMRRGVTLDQMRGAPSQFGFTARDLSRTNELVGLYQLAASMATTYGRYLNEAASPLRALHVAARSALEQHCEALGMDATSVGRFLGDVRSVLDRLPKNNRERKDVVIRVLGTDRVATLGDVRWPELDVPSIAGLEQLVRDLPGRLALTVMREERGQDAAFYWTLGERKIARAGGAVPQLDADETAHVRFTGRLQLLREANDGLWLEVAHHAVAPS